MKLIIGHCFLITQSNNWLCGENLSFQTRKGWGFHKHTTSAIMPLFTSEAYYVKILLSELIWHVLLRGSLNFCICITRFLHFYQPQRSCGQGNIFTPVCHSFCSQGGRGSASVHAGIPSPDQADTPARPGRHSPDQADPPGPGRPPQPGRHPPDLADTTPSPRTRQTPPRPGKHPPRPGRHPPSPGSRL